MWSSAAFGVRMACSSITVEGRRMTEPVDWNKLGRVLAGEYSEDQAGEVISWMRAEAACKLLAEVQQIWDLAHETRHIPDVETAWREVAKRARVYARDPFLTDRSPLRHTRKVITSVLSVAAIISLVLFAVLRVESSWQDAVPMVRNGHVDISSFEGRGATWPALSEGYLKINPGQFHCERV